MSETPTRGFRVVLTADRTLMADYRTLLDGMLGASQTTSTPLPLLEMLIARPVASAGVRAVQAPLGLRRVEAALLGGGFTRGEVAVVTPERLGRAVGRDTRIVAVSSGDPLGLGMNTSTMTGVVGGRSCTVVFFERLLARARRLRRVFPEVKIVVGGPGAWQLAQHNADCERLGVDHVLAGYCEREVAEVFRRIAASEGVPTVFQCRWEAQDAVPPIRGATVMGIVEISRGCGLGCDFCTLRDVPMTHLPVETVLADVETNVASGIRDISLVSEDVFRYGGAGGPRTNPPAVLELLRQIRSVDGVRMIQVDHANVASVAGFSDAELGEMHALLSDGARGRHVWVNLGVETASGELLHRSGANAKMRPVAPADWADFCRRQVLRLGHAGFVPMVSLLLGLPGESARDVEATERWVRALRGERVVVFPLFLAPVAPGARPFALGDMTAAHCRLFEECYRLNFKWIPRMLWDEQSRARVPLLRRLALAFFARAYVPWHKALFALRS